MELGPDEILVASRYRLGVLLGRGGMGSVYRAEHVELGRSVAIKLIGRGALDSRLVSRFERELRVAASIRHENVVSVTDGGRDEEVGPFLVMELLEGEALADRLARGTPPLDEALTILDQVLCGLEAVHAAGVLHRDLKPQNVFLCPRAEGPPRVKLLDFGVSKLFGETHEDTLTREGDVIGTPQYMAPEQLLGITDLDARVDVYAASVLLFRLLTGKLPFGRTRPDGALALEGLFGAPPSVRDERPDLPVALDEVVMRGLARRREERFESAYEMRRALREATEELGGIATPLPSLPPPEPSDARTAVARPGSGAVPRSSEPGRRPRDAESKKTAESGPAESEKSTSRGVTESVQSASGGATESEKSASRGETESEQPGSSDATEVEHPASKDPTLSPSTSSEVVSGGRRTIHRALITLGLASSLALVPWAVGWDGPWAEGDEDRTASAVPATSDATPASAPAPLRLGFVRYLPGDLVERHQAPLARYLEAQLDTPVVLSIDEDYVDTGRRLEQGELDVAALSAYALVLARRSHPSLVLLARAVNQGGDSYQGVIVARAADDSLRELTDLRGRVVCFVGQRSSSGYLFPRALLRRAGVDPDADLRASRLAGDHLAALRALDAGGCDAATVYASLFYEAGSHGLSPQRFRILASTDRIPYDTYVAGAHVDPALRERVRTALLSLEPGSSTATELFADSLGDLRAFLPATPEDMAAIDALVDVLDP